MDQSKRPIIRRASQADIDTIVDITNAAYAKCVSRMGREPQPMTADYHQMLAEHPIWLLCIRDRPVVCSS
jgi:hypothetical protein